MIGPGIHRLDKATYLSDPCERPSLSTSIARTLLSESPAIAWASSPRGGGLRDDPTAAMERGNAVEALLGLGDTELVCLPFAMPNAKGLDQPTNDELRLESAKEWKAQQEAAGRQVVKRADLEKWTNAATALRARLNDRGIFFDGESQLAMVWEEPGGVLARGRLDHVWMKQGIIRDLKVCESVNPKALARKFEDFGYDIQRAAYVRGFERLFPEFSGRTVFEFVFCEPEPPYEIVVCRANGEMRALGDYKWRRAVTLWGSCLAANRWPGYADGVIDIAPSTWALQDMVANGGGETLSEAA